MPWLFCGLSLGLLIGLGLMAWIVDLGGMCTSLRDDRTGIVTVEFKGALYELVRLLSDREVVKDDQPS